MVKPKGGRGKTAPYYSTHIRVPVPVKHVCEEVTERYRQRLESGLVPPVVSDSSEHYLSSDETPVLNYLGDVDKAVEVAKKILKKKKSARVSLELLINELYSANVSLDS